MKTIEYYENLSTVKLQKMLKQTEKIHERNEIAIDFAKEENIYNEDLMKDNTDYEIDMSIMRMELNKRLWFDE